MQLFNIARDTQWEAHRFSARFSCDRQTFSWTNSYSMEMSAMVFFLFSIVLISIFCAPNWHANVRDLSHLYLHFIWVANHITAIIPWERLLYKCKIKRNHQLIHTCFSIVDDSNERHQQNKKNKLKKKPFWRNCIWHLRPNETNTQKESEKLSLIIYWQCTPSATCYPHCNQLNSVEPSFFLFHLAFIQKIHTKIAPILF